MKIALLRSELYAFGLALATLNALSKWAVLSLDKHGLAGSIFLLFDISAIFWFALFALARIAYEDDSAERPSFGDWVVGFALLVSSLVPLREFAILALLASSTWLWFASRQGSPVRRIAIIGMGLCAPLFWGPLALRLLGPQLLLGDAWLVSLLAGLDHSGNLVLNPATGIEVAIYEGCSSFLNISHALLLVAVATQLFMVSFNRTIAVSLCLAILGMIAVNVTRIALLVRNLEYFDWLHDGMGSVLFSWLGLIVLMAIVGGGILRASRLRI